MLSLYIHVPFCVRKCHYCGFYSTVYDEQLVDAYINALTIEAASYKRSFSDRTFDSAYIGGGTPTVLSFGQLRRFFHLVRDTFDFSKDAEYTIEVNPSSTSLDQLRMMREYGVNRLSLGVQSFDDAVLHNLGRRYSARDAADAFDSARKAGFSNINIDLIFGVAGQTAVQWHDTLDKTMRLGPEHVSTYCLSLDEGSRFGKAAQAGKYCLPSDSIAVALQEQTSGILGHAGYSRYEISNYSLPGFNCRHNMNYWQRGEYLGLGPSAWSFINGRRYHNVEDVQKYRKLLTGGMSVKEDEEIMNTIQTANETLMLGLRTVSGVDLASFGHSFGTDVLERLERKMVILIEAGLLQRVEKYISLTEGGFLLADEVVVRLAL